MISRQSHKIKKRSTQKATKTTKATKATKATSKKQRKTKPTLTTNHYSTTISNKMKFSLTTTTTLFFTAAVLNNSNNNVVEAVLSPYVTCCEEQGGKYEILNTGDGQKGYCTKEGQNYEEKYFYEENCDFPPPTPAPTPSPTPSWTPNGYKYAVYAVNDSCGLKSGHKVKAEFSLKQNSHHRHKKTKVEVDVENDQCVYVGGTNSNDVDYTVKDSYVSHGNVSCEAIGNKNDGDCNLLGMNENSCVINIC